MEVIQCLWSKCFVSCVRSDFAFCRPNLLPMIVNCEPCEKVNVHYRTLPTGPRDNHLKNGNEDSQHSIGWPYEPKHNKKPRKKPDSFFGGGRGQFWDISVCHWKSHQVCISLWANSLHLFICCSFQKDLDFFGNRISHTSGLCHHWLNLTWHPCVRRPSFRPLTQSGLMTVLQFTPYGCVYENCVQNYF